MTDPLHHYTDPVALRALLQPRLPGFAEGALRITGLQLRYARRNTSQQRNPLLLTLGCELHVEDTARGRRGTQWLYGEVFRHAADAQACMQQHEARTLVQPAFGAPLVHLPDLQLVLWALPNDPGLAQLPALLDPVRAAALVPGAATGELQVNLLRYEPRQRATLRYDLRSAPGAAVRTVYAKAFRDDRAALIDQRFSHFWQQAARDPRAPLVAQPLGHDAAHRVVWQAPAMGEPLRDVLQRCQGSAEARRLVAAVADALAVLHAAPLQPAPGTLTRSVAHWTAEIERRRQKIARVDAALADRAGAIAHALQAGAPDATVRPLSLIHGDFHPDQCWVHEGRIVLFDFDEFTLGDPMEDLAEFALKLGQDPAGAALVPVLLDRYAQAAPARHDTAVLRWHLAIQSLLQAARAHKMQQPGWQQALQRWLADCEQRVATLHAGTPDRTPA